MIPKYEIYASLLTGAWMPWLENNRQEGRFHHLLQSTDAGNGKECSHFFRMLTGQTGSMQSPAMQRFSREATYLAEACSHATDKGGAAFFSLSGTTASQQFYNRLIGYSFNGYHRWATELLADNQGTEMTDWYRVRMAGRLLDLLKIPVACHHAEHSERVIACRARAALCVLHHRLTNAGDNPSGTLPAVLNLHDALYASQEAFMLEASARDEIIGLIDALTAGRKLRTPSPVGPTPTRSVAPEAAPALPADDPYVTAALKAMITDIETMKQAVGHLCEAAQKQPPAEPEQLLDSATVLKRLPISSTTLQRYRDRGSLPYIFIGGKYCYWEKDIKNIIEKGLNQKKNGTGNRKPKQPDH